MSTLVNRGLFTLVHMPEGFAKRIKQAADEYADGVGIARVDIARALGVKRGAVSHWFNGRSEPTGHNLARLSELLGVRDRWLIEGRLPKRLSQTGTQVQGKGADNIERAAEHALDDAAHTVLTELAAKLTPDALELLERSARDYLWLQGTRTVEADAVANLVGLSMADLKREGLELLRAWLKLPENEREQFKQQIEVAALRYSRVKHEKQPAHEPGARAPSKRSAKGSGR
jgi:transcriptional regulator with XRE-family HTH domain